MLVPVCGDPRSLGDRCAWGRPLLRPLHARRSSVDTLPVVKPTRWPWLVPAFRAVAHLEAVSWAGLLTGMALEYVFVRHHDLGDRLVFAFGSVHGGLVLAYGALGAALAVTRSWGAREWTFGVVASFVPFATVALDLWMVRSGRYRAPLRPDTGSAP